MGGDRKDEIEKCVFIENISARFDIENLTTKDHFNVRREHTFNESSQYFPIMFNIGNTEIQRYK